MSVANKKRILFGASYSIIEPLGVLHLAGLARDMGWERKIHLVPDHDFESFFTQVRDFEPDVVGFNIYTGAHLQLFAAYRRLKRDFPHIQTIIGGPHATYFPVESANHADYVVMSEGFGRLREILHGSARPGILPMRSVERFPHPDRATFYRDYPQHAASPIKSFITMTGCPYKCTYCYNSSEPADIAATPQVIEQVKSGLALSVLGKKLLGMGGRLFPHNVRPVADVLAELAEVADRWPVKSLYCQDDVHGFDIKPGGAVDQFAERWPSEVGVPYHAQMRWEMTIGDAGQRRLDKLREAGCFGMTLAIEAADPFIRREVLDRGMKEETMFSGMRNLIGRGYKIRTEQITGLPYGATTEPTSMNLDADLELVELNVRLRRTVGGQTMAWASTLAPYAGTKLGQYCERFGHYENLDNHDVPDTFFKRSVLRFPREWIGPSLALRKSDDSVWLGPDELDRYRDQNAELRRHFQMFSLIPDGHKLARAYLEAMDFTLVALGDATEQHLRRCMENGDVEASDIVQRIASVVCSIESLESGADELQRDLSKVAAYLACLPRADLLLPRLVNAHRAENGAGILDPETLSRAIRHHLYDHLLYNTDRDPAPMPQQRARERYPAKL